MNDKLSGVVLKLRSVNVEFSLSFFHDNRCPKSHLVTTKWLQTNSLDLGLLKVKLHDLCACLLLIHITIKFFFLRFSKILFTTSSFLYYQVLFFLLARWWWYRNMELKPWQSNASRCLRQDCLFRNLMKRWVIKLHFGSFDCIPSWQLQWNLSATTTSIINFITCDLFSNVF